MHKTLTLILALFTLSANILYAQEEKASNLITNGDFETTNDRTLKKVGGLEEFCEGWFPATFEPADIFSRNVKSEDVAVPLNKFGVQEDKASGDYYAGFRAYAPGGKASRSYLEAPIRTPMQKGKMYCVKFDVSLSDLSKYAVNYIGAYLPNKRYLQKNTGDIVEAYQIKDRSNRVMNDMDGWQTICTSYIAAGGENHIIIGCFEREDKLNVEKVKRPRTVTGAQAYEAYYYVDNVEVFEVQAKSQCDCGDGENRAPDVIYSKTVVKTADMTPGQILTETDIYFASLKSEINAMAERALKEVIEIMNANPQIRLEVVGNCDNDEFREGEITSMYANMGKQRADAVVEYLISQGISQLRVVPKSVENTKPANTRPTPMSIAQNRRVEFVVK